MQLDTILERVKAIPAFQGRVQGALQLARLQQQNQLPQVTPAAFVIPTGISGGAVTAVTGLYRQTIGEAVAVVIVVRSADDPRHGRAGDPLAAACWDVIHALAGTEMGDIDGQLQFRRGWLVSLADGAAVYQLDFELQDQLRIQR